MSYTVEINSIVSDLNKVSEKFFSYEGKRKKALEDYRGEALSQELKNLELDIKSSVMVNVNSMEKATARMIAEAKAGNHYDINDPAVANAAALLSKGGISVKAAEDVIKSFAGNITALELIKASAHEDYIGLFKKWIFDNVGSLKIIQAKVSWLAEAEPSNYPGIVSDLREKLVDFAVHQGVALDSTSEALEEMRMRNICGMMDIDYNNL